MHEQFYIKGNKYFLSRREIFTEKPINEIERPSEKPINPIINIIDCPRGIHEQLPKSEYFFKKPQENAVNIIINIYCREFDMLNVNQECMYISWWFNYRFRTRSSLFWPGSGLPCAYCCSNLWSQQGTIKNSDIMRVASVLKKGGIEGLPGVRYPTKMEIFEVVAEAIRICDGLKVKDSTILENILYSELFDLSTGESIKEIFPVDLGCDCA